MASEREAWLSLLPADPRPALLESDESFARFVTLTAVLGVPENDADVRRERMLDAMLRHQADDGRYLSPGGTTGKMPSAWAFVPCVCTQQRRDG